MLNYNKLRSLRKKANMLQSDLAEKLNVSPSTIGMWEQGRNQPSVDDLSKMSQLFGVSTDYLLDVPTRRPEEIPVFDETLDQETALKLVKDYINNQSDWSEEKKKMSLRQIELVFGDDN